MIARFLFKTGRIERAFSSKFLFGPLTQAGGLGWDNGAPLAL
jgi:hypothetical protein